MTSGILSKEQFLAVETIVKATETKLQEDENESEWYPQHPHQCLLLQAVAGSGKSSTLLAMTNALQRNWTKERNSVDVEKRRILLLAFNSHMAINLRTRILAEKNEDEGNSIVATDVFTLHSYGLHLLRSVRDPEPVVNPNKMYKIACSLLQRPAGISLDEWQDIKKQVDAIRHRGDVLDLEITPRPMLLHVAILHDMLLDRKGLDQEDQIYHCLASENELTKRQVYDVVLVDEGQDLNPSSMVFLKRCVLHPRSILCVVGDSRQAIYAFRGAMPNSMMEIQQNFHPHRMYLTTTFRCPRRVAFLASHLNPLTQYTHLLLYTISGCTDAIRAAVDAPVGEIRFFKDRAFTVECISSGSSSSVAVLARTNMILLNLLSVMFRMDTWRVAVADRCRLKWMTPVIHNQLLLLRQIFSDVEEHTSLESMHAEILQTHVCGGTDVCPFDRTIIRIIEIGRELDGSSCTIIASAWFTFLSNVVAGADGGTECADVVLSTVHSAKGQEYKHVIILDYDLFGSLGFRHDDEEQKQQESNLLYIAITRSTDTLTLVHSTSNQINENETKKKKRKRSTMSLIPEEIIRYSQQMWSG